MIRFLIPYLKEYKKEAFLGCTGSFLEAIFELILPVLMARIVDVGIQRGNISYTLGLGLLMIASAIIAMFLGTVASRYFGILGQNVAADIRQREYEKIQTYSFANLEAIKTSSLVTRLTNDVTNIEKCITMGGKMLFRSPVMIVFALILAGMMNRALLIVFWVAIPILIGITALLLICLKPAFDDMQEKTDELNLVTQENLIGMRLVKAFVREEEEREKFDKKNHLFFKAATKAYSYMMMGMPAFQFVTYGTIVAIMWIGGHMIMADTMEVGTLSGFITYVHLIMISLVMISFVMIMLSRGIASIKRIEKVMAQTSSIQDGKKNLKEVKDGSIRFKNVSFSYQEEKTDDVLQNISFEIPSGGMVGIIGSTGAGKTSLIQLISRLYDVKDGAVYVGGENVKEYSLEALRDNVAVVLQKNILFSGSIYDNLRWGKKDASLEEVKDACKMACADEFIENFSKGYEHDLGQGGVNVSGGQRQRLCIARALLKKPKILILDDSTSAVDMTTDEKIRHSLTHQLPNTTKLMIAQRIHSVWEADMILVLDKGRLVGIGKHQNLLETCQTYREIYDSQQKKGEENV